MYINRHQIIEQFKEPIYAIHPQFPELLTFTCINKWKKEISIELPRFCLRIHSIDYLQSQLSDSTHNFQTLQFQQDSYRLWYQVDGIGILQNATKKIFGTARPGLLGMMDRGERHTYLHQRGNFAAFQLCFSVQPSSQAKCYWNAEIEGKIVLNESERISFENTLFTMFLSIVHTMDVPGLSTIARLLDLIEPLFAKNIMLIEDARFPKNKVKSLVAMARNYMNVHYATAQHQRDLEMECNVDINYLNILFKRETGQTLYAYLTSVRLEHAKYLLTASDTSVAEIASKTGYPNANSFSRAFKRCEKTTPQEFRTRQQKNPS